MRIILGNIKSKLIMQPGDPRGLYTKIREYFSVPHPRRFFSYAFKEGKWDGTYPFLSDAGYFLTGLFPMMRKFLKSEGAQYTLIDERGDIPQFELQRDYYLGGIELRENQKKVVDDVINSSMTRGIVDGATNAGKDYIMACLYKNLQTDTLIVIHNTTIFRKAVEFMSQHYDVGTIADGKFEPKQLTIAMQKTLLNMARKDSNVKKYLSNIKVLFVDECHRAAADDYSKLIQIIPAPIKIGFSGTAIEMDNELKKIKVIGLFGPKLSKISNMDLIEEGYSQKPIVKIYDAQNKIGTTFYYRDEYEDGLMFNTNRCDLITNLVNERTDKQILISFNEIAHGEFMLNKILLSDNQRIVEMVHGEDKWREEKIESFKNGEINILLSSMILKEGANIPNINTLILAHGGKSIITIKQYIGRALRHDGIHSEVEIIDFYDHSKSLSSHSKERFKIYKNEGFDIEFQYTHSKLGIPI